MSTSERLTGRFTVSLPPTEAFGLFTARGEQRWVPNWNPVFPAGAVDDTAPDTVFETTGEGRTTTWVVVDSDPGRSIRYARIAPGLTAGTVTVLVEQAGTGSAVSVTYALTALTAAGEKHLDEFAAGYPAFLRSWESAIARAT